jgi:hypothetical protein
MRGLLFGDVRDAVDDRSIQCIRSERESARLIADGQALRLRCDHPSSSTVGRCRRKRLYA